MILDANGNPISSRSIYEPQTAQVAHLQREFDNHPARGLTPARLQSILVEAEEGDLVRQLELADDMEERDAHLFSELNKRKGAISALSWELQAPDNASAAEKALTDEMSDWMKGLPDFEDMLFGVMDGVLKGYAAHEMVWRMEGRVLLPQLTFRPQRWFTLDRETRSELRLRTHQSDGLVLQPFSWLMHVHRSRNGYLARTSLCRVLAWPYLFKNYAVRDLAEFLEIYGLPLRVGKYPSGASDDEKRRLLQAVVQIGHNAAGIIPQGMALEFQAAAAGTQVPFDSMQDRMEACESKAIVGQTLTSGEGKHGTQALGKVHNDVRMDIRNADARQVESTINRQLIHPLAVLNKSGVDPRRLPRFSLDIAEPEDLVAYADNLPKLATAGLRIPVKWAQEKLRIPEPAEGEEVMHGTAPAAAPDDGEQLPGRTPPKALPEVDPKKPGAKKPDPKAALATELPDDDGAPRDALDDLVDEAAADWRPMLAPMVEPLMAELHNAVARGESLADFRDRLPELLASMDGRPLAERLARASFMARLAGEADLDLGGD